MKINIILLNVCFIFNQLISSNGPSSLEVPKNSESGTKEGLLYFSSVDDKYKVIKKFFSDDFWSYLAKPFTAFDNCNIFRKSTNNVSKPFYFFYNSIYKQMPTNILSPLESIKNVIDYPITILKITGFLKDDFLIFADSICKNPSFWKKKKESLLINNNFFQIIFFSVASYLIIKKEKKILDWIMKYIPYFSKHETGLKVLWYYLSIVQFCSIGNDDCNTKFKDAEVKAIHE